MTDALRKGEVRCPPELLDVMVVEEQWLAAHADRTPRTRDGLAVERPGTWRSSG